MGFIYIGDHMRDLFVMRNSGESTYKTYCPGKVDKKNSDRIARMSWQYGRDIGVSSLTGQRTAKDDQNCDARAK